MSSKPNKQLNLDTLRQRLDQIDRSLVQALAERMDVVLDVARFKNDSNRKVRDMSREEDLLTKLARYASESGLDSYFITKVYQEILDYSVRMQQHFLTEQRLGAHDESIKVAYRGMRGSYADMATQQLFGAQGVEHARQVTHVPMRHYADVLEAVANGDVHYAVLPIENSATGSYHEVYNALFKRELYFAAEEVVRIEYCLASYHAFDIDQLNYVVGSSLGLASCSDFIDSLKKAHIETEQDVSVALAQIKKRPRGTKLHAGIIITPLQAHLKGLHILERNVANQLDNFIRFIVVSAEPLAYDLRIPCKTSIVIATGHQHGDLVSCLTDFSEQSLNLTKLESRPRPGSAWEYLFYLDFEGNLEQPHVHDTIEKLKKKVSYIKIFGSYPARTTPDARPAEPRPISLRSIAPQANITDQSSTNTTRRAPSERITFEARKLRVGGSEPFIVSGYACHATAQEWESLAKRAKEHGIAGLWASAPRAEHGGPSTYDPFARQLAAANQAARLVNLPLVFRVASPIEVEQAMQHADMLYVDGIDTKNLRLLDALGLVDKPVVVGRDPMGSLETWTRVADHIIDHGNRRIALCESGVRTLEQTAREMNDLGAIAQLRRESPLPILLSPRLNHTAHDTRPDLIKAGLAAGAHGFVIELNKTEHATELSAHFDQWLKTLQGTTS